MAYWHGSANHLKIGKKAGFLIALMGETGPGGVPIKDDPAINDEHGSSVSFLFLAEIIYPSHRKQPSFPSDMLCSTTLIIKGG